MVILHFFTYFWLTRMKKTSKANEKITFEQIRMSKHNSLYYSLRQISG